MMTSRRFSPSSLSLVPVPLPGLPTTLRSHVSLGANPRVLWDVCLSRRLSVSDCETEICDDTSSIPSHEHILRLDVSVSNSWLALRPKDLSVKVDKAGDCAHEDPQGLRLRQRHPVEVVIETAKWVIVGDKPQLCATVSRGAIGTNVAEDVFVPQ